MLIIILSSAIKVFPEYQRGVIFRLGRINPPKGPGHLPHHPHRRPGGAGRPADASPSTCPAQEVITKDNVPAKVNAVAYFRVTDPSKAVIEVQNYILATSQIAQTTLRSVLGQSDLDHLLTERDKLNARLQEIIDEQTEPWGVKVSIVEIKDVEIPANMQRAMARQAEAERERRAKVIAAEGEYQASEKLRRPPRSVEEPGRHPAALPADPGRDRHREELHHRVPDTDRPHRAVPQETPGLIDPNCIYFTILPPRDHQGGRRRIGEAVAGIPVRPQASGGTSSSVSA